MKKFLDWFKALFCGNTNGITKGKSVIDEAGSGKATIDTSIERPTDEQVVE